MNLDFSALYESIQAYDRIIVCRHVNPDPDALGSQAGLAALLCQAFPEKTILKAGALPKDLQFLTKMDRVKKEDYHEALVLITDTGNKARVDGGEFLDLAQKTIKIDHHPNEEHYTDLEFVNTAASSSCEVIFDFYAQFADHFSLTPKIAYLLYAGLSSDTGRFLYNNTTSHTFEVASRLRQEDFDLARLNRHFIEKEEKVVRFEGYVQEHFQLNEVGVGSILLSNELLAAHQMTHDDTSSLVGVLGNVKEVKAWALFIEKFDEPGVYRCRLRSKEVPIVDIARRHDGGGHPLASGANAYSLAETEEIIAELSAVIKEAEVCQSYQK